MKIIAFAVGLVGLLTASAFGIVAPRNGGRLPDAYYARKAEDRTAFQVKRGWIQKVRALRAKREHYLTRNKIASTAYLPQEYSLSGEFRMPVLLGEFSNRPATYPASDLDQELFTGPWTPGTLADYFSEISYGALTVTGMVTDWVTVSQVDAYYEGTGNGLGSDGKVGQFLLEVLTANDPTIDFSTYDNDGPDGIPNSGDDDGYVDFIAFAHSESGGECVNANIWSHSWALSAWADFSFDAYETDDTAAGGGFILIDDYTMQPGYSCADNMIEIGVYCHETGHAFDLPDLYDADGGGPEGIGEWGIMGSGNWNLPSRPAHPCAWTRMQVGWVIATVVDWQGGTMSIPQIETNAVAYKLPFTDDHFRRIAECAISGSYSLRCGVNNVEGSIKGWDGGNGYGNLWNETVERDFTYDVASPVTFSYDYHYELETDYDFAYTIIRVDGTETTLATYNGLLGNGNELLDLTPVLSAYTPPVDYQLIFKVESDWAYSDEDGKNPTTCGAFIIDDISVTGGGENYTTDFETFVDGWHQHPAQNPATEYWVVENRQAVGFDANLHGTGLLIYHVDDEVIYSGNGNCGGYCYDFIPYDDAVRGVVLEQADGLDELFAGTNRGNAGDSYPGSSNNTAFNSVSNPNSYDNTNRNTQIAVTSISASSNPMSAYMVAGDPAPTLSAMQPDSMDNDIATVDVIIDGSLVRYGASLYLMRSGETDIEAMSVEWVDPLRITGTFYIYGRVGGFWDLKLVNPDGQEAILSNALYLTQIVAAQLQSASVEYNGEGVEIRFELSDLTPEETLLIARSTSLAGPWIDLQGSIDKISPNTFRYLDSSVEAGKTYYYRLDVRNEDGSVRELYRGSAVVPSHELVLEQNVPNPFNPSTVISFYLPAESIVRLEIFDINGRLIRQLAEGVLPSGPHRRSWDGRNQNGENVASGIYIYRLTAGKNHLSRKMVLLK
jgi:M6 family metalloprotease-like protein